MFKHDVITKYNLPKDVKFCVECVMSNQRPRITFDDNGVCSACNFNKDKQSFDWELREKELIELRRNKMGMVFQSFASMQWRKRR